MAHTTEQLNYWFAPQLAANTANVYYQVCPSPDDIDPQFVAASIPKNDLAQLPDDLVFLRMVSGYPLFGR